MEKQRIFDVHMVHFIGSLGKIDATREKHWVPRRLFIVSDDLKYPEHSHPVLEGNFNQVEQYDKVTIFHLGHLPVEYMDYILKRYKQHAEDSIIHSQDFLHDWKLRHLFGRYPVKDINPIELPKQICDRYEIDKDEFYFFNRGIELKHPLMVKQWADYFKPESVLDLGCGRGPYLYFWKWFVKNCGGIEISKWAVENAFTSNIIQDDITKPDNYDIVEDENTDTDLITAIDVLEHLNEEQLNRTLDLMSNYGKRFLFSIPFLGDPNLEADSTHIIKETKEWWVEKLLQYFNIRDAPKDWLFANQLLIGEKR